MDTYVVTERAGKRVAGRFVKPGDELQLTPAEAAHELREGTLVRKGATLAAAFTTDSEQLAALRERAKGREVEVSTDQVAEAAVDEAKAGQAEPASKPARKVSKGEANG